MKKYQEYKINDSLDVEIDEDDTNNVSDDLVLNKTTKKYGQNSSSQFQLPLSKDDQEKAR